MATSILHLTVEKGPKKGEILDRKPGTLIRIGRVVKGNTFAIKDPGISQKHIVIKFLPEICRWAIEDLDTSNGTLINEVKIAPSVPFPLSDGDTVKIGESTSISVKIDGAEAEMGKEEKNVPDLKGNVGNRRGRSKKADEPVDSVVKVEKCEDSRRGRVVKGNTLAIKDPGVSQKHLVIKFLPEICRWGIEDLDTSNGTLINDVKIAPSVPFPLSDGVTVKIGESTSISVKIDGAEAEAETGKEEKNVPDLKGNVGNRRGRSKKADEAVDSVVKVEKCEDSGRIAGRKRGRPKKAEETVGVVEKNEIFDLVVEDSVEKPRNLGRGRPRRGTSRLAKKAEVLDVVAKDPVEEPKNLRRGRSRKGGDSCKVLKGDEVSNLVLEDNVEVPVEESKNLRRGRPRKGETSKVSKEDKVSDLVVADSMLKDPVEEPKNLRRGRSRKGGDSCKVLKGDEVEDNVEVPVEESKNLRRGRPGKGETSKVSKEDKVSDLVVADSMLKDTGRMSLRRAPASTAKVFMEEEVPKANLEGIEVSGKEKLDEGNAGDNQCEVVGSGKEAEFEGVVEERIADIEKMTLGEWFDSMERFLPMAINDVAEEIISSLREKARRFDEFIGKSSDAC